MLVVSDSTPLNILVRIGAVEILPQLYGRIIIPPAIAGELTHPNTPQMVRAWVESAPPWLEVRALRQVDPGVAADLGERQAICLAVELRADLLLVDDRQARRAARKLNLAITGTLGVLELAALRIIALPAVVARLRQTNFYIAEDLLETVIERDAARKRLAHPGGDRPRDGNP